MGYTTGDTITVTITGTVAANGPTPNGGHLLAINLKDSDGSRRRIVVDTTAAGVTTTDHSGNHNDRMLTTREVAELLGVQPITVAGWVRAGRLPKIRTLGGHYRYRESDIVARFKLPPESNT